VKLEAEWITGFVDGEGGFHVAIARHDQMSMGYQVLPEFTVVQPEHEIKLLFALKKFFGCGQVVPNHGSRQAFRVRKVEHLRGRIIPFFEKHSLKTSKRIDFINFRRVVLLMQDDAHLTKDGLAQIRSIQQKINRSRLRESPVMHESV
jgi:hypothetical protein